MNGTPADSVIWAIDQHGIDFTPDLVVSGINFGQNIGPLTDVSGTVGAARAAAARGIPALASSQGFGDPVDYPERRQGGAGLARGQPRRHRIAAPARRCCWRTSTSRPARSGAARAQVTVPVATDQAGRDYNGADCTSTATNPADDVDAFNEGFVTLSTLNPTSTTGTTQAP